MVLDAYGTIIRDTLYAINASTYIGGKVNTGQSSRLLLGSYAGYESRFLVQFTQLPADTIVVDTLRLIMHSESNLGDPTTFINGTIYRVTKEWTESVNTDSTWEIQSSIDPSPETSLNFSIEGADSAELRFDLPTALVDIWRDTTSGDQNFGLLFDFNQADQIVKLFSSEATLQVNTPKLIYIYKNPTSGDAVYDTVYSSNDASLIDFHGTFDDNSLYVGAGYFIYSFIRFDLSQIPEEALVSTANFVLSKNSEESVSDSTQTISIYLRDVTTDYADLPFYQIDSTFSTNIYYNMILTEQGANQLSLADIYKKGAGQYFLQDIVNKEIKYGSFYLEPALLTQDIYLCAINGINNASSLLRPYLVLEYYLNPKSRL